MNPTAALTPRSDLNPNGLRLGQNLNLAGLLAQIANTAVDLTAASRGFVLLYDDETGELERSAVGGEGDTAPADPDDIDHDVVEAVLAEGGSTLGQHDGRQLLCVPLPGHEHAQGVIYVDRPAAAGRFAPARRDLLTALARQAAVTLDNARHFRRTDQALARRVEELSLFQRIDQELNKSLNLDHTLGLALDWAMSLTAADSGSIGLLHDSDTGPELALLVYRGEAHDEPRLVPADHPVLARVLDTGRSVNLETVDETTAVDGTAASQLAVPIQRDGEVIGLISLESHERDAFGGEDVTFVERFADRAAVAIANATLYEQIQAAHDAKSEFISIVTHELRIPLTSIRGYSDLLRRGLAGELNDQQGEFMEVIHRNLERMTVLLRDLGDINRMQTGRMKLEIRPVNLEAVIADAVAGLQAGFDQRNQSISLLLPDDLPSVMADPVRVTQILTNLLSNAHKYTPDGGAITVTAVPAETAVAIAVADNGVGIAEVDQARLFEQFFRSDDPAVRQQPGWGLGLSIVRRLVEAQEGEIMCESTPGAGSTFTFTLPRTPRE